MNVPYMRSADFSEHHGSGSIYIAVVRGNVDLDRIMIRIEVATTGGGHQLVRGTLSGVDQARRVADRLRPALVKAGWRRRLAAVYAREIAAFLESERGTIGQAVRSARQETISF